MIASLCLDQNISCQSSRLVAQPLRPMGLRHCATGGHKAISSQLGKMRSPYGRRAGPLARPLGVGRRLAIFAHKEERRTNNPVSSREDSGIPRPICYGLSVAPKIQSTPEVFEAMAAASEACERSQLIVDILKAFRQLVGSVERGASRVA